ncbi:proofreading thioesterase in enterobactin biosynthesis EntH [Klebsiella michiganensis]|uniref:Proofreading thioesterase in enterobactin biosynthesis EntH n=1 Tax=Klebsiella michiganensis TaxID=1134687 RepID=A0A7H4N4Z7_9ENTR|nr:proofreading thioesterase in enterobactin biosynthesis EntH [Klebsiella michiganensis]
MAWKRQLTLDELNATSVNTMVAHLGIVYTRLEEGLLEAEMPVDARTHQPFGLLHGGASAALAETLGSMAGWLMTEEGQCVVGTELQRHPSPGGLQRQSPRRMPGAAPGASGPELGNCGVRRAGDDAAVPARLGTAVLG